MKSNHGKLQTIKLIFQIRRFYEPNIRRETNNEETRRVKILEINGREKERPVAL